MMGMCLEDFGHVSIEVRRESFYVHTDYESWKGEPHPELMLADLEVKK
jgi:hypothetical protein